MPIVTRHSTVTVVVLAFALLLIAGTFVWSGIYNIGADDTHTRPVYSMLQMLRERSITVRANKLHPPPNLDDAALIRQGAGNYNAMCTGCHLGPGLEATELSKGLYPSPPNFSKVGVGDPAHHFWVIKHGIKASGMPAWGKSMGDEYIWGMVAFLQQLPKLDAAQYKTLVASSGGHSHGGGESGEHHHHDEDAADHHHDDDEADHHHDEAEAGHGMAGMDMGTDATAAHEHAVASASEGVMHTHADGTREMHPTPKPGVPLITMPAKPATKTPTKPAAPDPHAGMAMPAAAPAARADGDDHH